MTRNLQHYRFHIGVSPEGRAASPSRVINLTGEMAFLLMETRSDSDVYIAVRRSHPQFSADTLILGDAEACELLDALEYHYSLYSPSKSRLPSRVVVGLPQGATPDNREYSSVGPVDAAYGVYRIAILLTRASLLDDLLIALRGIQTSGLREIHHLMPESDDAMVYLFGTDLKSLNRARTLLDYVDRMVPAELIKDSAVQRLDARSWPSGWKSIRQSTEWTLPSIGDQPV